MGSTRVFASNKELMSYLKDSGSIKSDFVYDVMCSVDRKHFMNNNSTSYTDKPQIIAYGKTISAAHMHGRVLECLSDKLRDGGRVLDIGSGSGYLTTCMAMALRKPGIVIGMDCIPGFRDMAHKTVENNYPVLLTNNRVEFVVGDGRQGYLKKSPYNIIHVGLAAADVPQSLLGQLAPGGCLIMPIGDELSQILCLFNKSSQGVVEEKELCHVRYGYFDDVKDMLLLESNNKTKNRTSSNSNNTVELSRQSNSQIRNHATLSDNVDSSEKIIDKCLERIEKKIHEYQNGVNQKIDSIISKFNEQNEKTSQEVLQKMNNLETNFKNLESDYKVFGREMKTKFEEYHSQVSKSFEKFDKKINDLSNEFQQLKVYYAEKEKKLCSDNVAAIEKMYDKFTSLLEGHKTVTDKATMKWDESNQLLQNLLNKWDSKNVKNANEKLSANNSFESSNNLVNNQDSYKNLEKKLDILNKQLMVQNERIDIHEKILEIQIKMFEKQQSRRTIEKKDEKEETLQKLTKTIFGLSEEIDSIELELESEKHQTGPIIATHTNALANCLEKA